MRDKQREETRRRLYQAALEVFSRDGVDSCRIEDIATRAEVSRAAFYFHFPTKDDVLIDLLAESEQPVLEALARLPEDTPLEEFLLVLTRSMAAYWQQGERGKLLIDVFATQLRRLRQLAHDREAVAVRSVVGKRFQLASARGEISPMIPAEVIGDFLLLNCLAAMASWCAQPVMPLEATLAGVVQLFLDGARMGAFPAAGADRARRA